MEIMRFSEKLFMAKAHKIFFTRANYMIIIKL